MIVGTGSATVYQIADAITGAQPSDPIVDQIWIDNSTDTPLIKSWDGVMWVTLGELTSGLALQLDELNEQISSLTDDNLIDLKERQSIKDRLTDMLGKAPLDTETVLLTVTQSDTLGKGNFATVRKSAVNAGVLTSHADYVALATQYNNLKAYLELLTPIKPWNTSVTSRNELISIDRVAFRDKWLQYQIAVNALQNTTDAQLKKNADNIQVGGRNLIRNSTFNKVDELGLLFDWRNVNAKFEVIDAETDRPNSSIIKATATGNTTNLVYSLYSNKFPARIGDVFAYSFQFKVTNPTAWDMKIPLIVEYYNASDVRVEFKELSLADLGLGTIVANTWYRGTFKSTVTNLNVSYGVARPVLYKNGEIFFREFQVERGSVATDFMIAPEDSDEQITMLETKVSGIEQSITSEGITSTVMNNTSFQQRMNEKANSEELGDLATKEELSLAVDNLNQDIDGKISGIDFSPFAKTSELTQQADNLTASFKAGGGVNLVRNSTGFANTDFWLKTGTMGTTQTSELKPFGLMSGFFSPLGTAGSIEQVIDVRVGQSVTLSAFIKKVGDGATGGATIQLLEGATVVATIGLPANGGVSPALTKFETTYKTKAGKLTVKIVAGAGSEALFSGVMLNYGFTSFAWTTATGEIYNANVRMDISGITVSQIAENGTETGRTKMTPDKFAGYYDTNNDGIIDETANSADEVFRMDKDEFVMKKATVKKEITMGTVKVLEIQTQTFKGWVWVANQQ